MISKCSIIAPTFYSILVKNQTVIVEKLGFFPISPISPHIQLPSSYCNTRFTKREDKRFDYKEAPVISIKYSKKNALILGQRSLNFSLEEKLPWKSNRCPHIFKIKRQDFMYFRKSDTTIMLMNLCHERSRKQFLLRKLWLFCRLYAINLWSEQKIFLQKIESRNFFGKNFAFFDLWKNLKSLGEATKLKKHLGNSFRKKTSLRKSGSGGRNFAAKDRRPLLLFNETPVLVAISMHFWAIFLFCPPMRLDCEKFLDWRSVWVRFSVCVFATFGKIYS